MSELSIFDALNSYVETNIGSIPAAVLENVAFLGKTYVPEAETPYLETSMPSIGGRMLTTGTAGVYEWKGVFQISCNWPIGGGLQEVLQQRDAVRVLFPNGLSLATSDNFVIRFFAASVKPPVPNGAWVNGPVQMPWFLHEAVT